MDVGLVCDSCTTFNEMGAPGCRKCGAALSLDSSGGGSSDAISPVMRMRTCPSCRADVSADQRFCGGCGNEMPEETREAVPMPEFAQKAKKKSAGKKTMFFGAMQASRAKLVLIKGDGLDGVSFTLAGDEHLAGRDNVALLFEEDPFLSPTHANFLYRNGKLVVRDEDSENGVFIRIRGEHKLTLGDRFLVGEQVIQIETSPDGGDPVPEPDGTYYYATPDTGSDFRLVQVLRGGDTGLAYLSSAEVSLGRENNDINFPDDPFISGHHARVASSGGTLTLTDLGSKNGTFLRVNHESELEHGDYVFMGQQLLRVEIV